MHNLPLRQGAENELMFYSILQEGTRTESVTSYVIAGEGLYLFTFLIKSLSAAKIHIGSNA